MLRLAESNDPIEHPSIAFFLNSRHDAWGQTQLRELEGTRDSWQTVERLAVGANFRLVSRRLDAAQKIRAMFIAQTGANQSGLLVVDLARKLLDRIVVASIRVWFPLTMEFIRSFDWKDLAGQMERRAPIVLRLGLLKPPGFDQGLVNVNILLEASENGDAWARDMLDVDKNPHLVVRQHVVFAVAAVVSLRLSRWSQADRSPRSGSGRWKTHGSAGCSRPCATWMNAWPTTLLLCADRARCCGSCAPSLNVRRCGCSMPPGPRLSERTGIRRS